MTNIDGVKLLGFADDNDEISEYLAFQMQEGYDEQDKRLGMDQIYLEVGDQSRSTYGGITAIVIAGGLISIQLEDAAAQKLRVDSVIEIEVIAPEPEVELAMTELCSMARQAGIRCLST
jgi:hypothetical protein